MKPLTVAKAPCKSCPYRRDVPSGVWGKEEYDKLPIYDKTIVEQLMGGGYARFDCHQRDGNLCAGWVATHGAVNLLALRLASERVAEDVWDYKSPVPVFKSGADAAAHGIKAINRPGARARRMIQTLTRKKDRDGGWK